MNPYRRMLDRMIQTYREAMRPGRASQGGVAGGQAVLTGTTQGNPRATAAGEAATTTPPKEVVHLGPHLRKIAIEVWRDPTARVLLGANLLTIVIALIEGWELGTVMWIYWAQSIIIGFFTVIQMLSLREFSTEGLEDGGQPTAPPTASKRQLAFFFALHYGIFHLAYMVFLICETQMPRDDALSALICVGAFLANHFYSFLRHRAESAGKRLNIGGIMILPYARVIPMHLTIVLGLPFGAGAIGTVFFLLLKTLADLLTHRYKHLVDSLVRRPESRA
jgi:hypothetical protein